METRAASPVTSIDFPSCLGPAGVADERDAQGLAFESLKLDAGRQVDFEHAPICGPVRARTPGQRQVDAAVRHFDISLGTRRAAGEVSLDDQPRRVAPQDGLAAFELGILRP